MEMRNPYKIEVYYTYVNSYTECVSCGVQFKDADMWIHSKFECAPSGHRICINEHVCPNCAKNLKEATKKFMDEDDYAQYIKVENQIKKLKSKHKGK